MALRSWQLLMFLVGLALVIGVLSGGCSAALTAPRSDQLPGRE